MNQIIQIVLIFLLSINLSVAQESTQGKPRYNCWLIPLSGSIKARGFISSVTDSSISLVAVKKAAKDSLTTEVMIFNYADIKLIKVRKKNSIGNGALAGSLVGLFIGGVLGLAQGSDDPDALLSSTAGEKAIAIGIPFAIVGSGVGAWIGSSRKKMIINGSQENFRKYQRRLTNYSRRTS